jgi:peroxiredoxin
MPLKTGETAPDVTLPGTDGKPVALSSLWADGPLVLLFFPLAFTSTCTAELCGVRDDLPAYTGLRASVAAVSVDSPYALQRFQAEVGAGYPFLSDFNREASRAYGVLREAPLGPGLLDVSDRAAFVVRDGRVDYAWHSANPGLLPPFDEIKRALDGG